MKNSHHWKKQRHEENGTLCIFVCCALQWLGYLKFLKVLFIRLRGRWRGELNARSDTPSYVGSHWWTDRIGSGQNYAGRSSLGSRCRGAIGLHLVQPLGEVAVVRLKFVNLIQRWPQLPSRKEQKEQRSIVNFKSETLLFKINNELVTYCSNVFVLK